MGSGASFSSSHDYWTNFNINFSKLRRSSFSALQGVRFGSCSIPKKKGGNGKDRCSHCHFVVSTSAHMFKKENVAIFHCFGIYDGHGKCAGASDLASDSLLRTFQSDLEKIFQEKLEHDVYDIDTLPELVLQSLKSAFAKIGSQIRAKFSGRLVGSTATVMLIFRSVGNDNWRSICGWLGNSQAVVVNANGRETNFITQNHCLDLSRESERVKEVAAIEKSLHRPGSRKTVVQKPLPWKPSWIHNEVSGVSTILTRAFEGGLVSPAVTDVPEIVCHELSVGSRIVLASHSVWRDTSLDVLVESKYRNPSDAAAFLCLTAIASNLTGGCMPTRSDNTAIVIDI